MSNSVCIFIKVFKNRISFFSKKKEITTHTESSKDGNNVKMVATIKLIEICACAVLIQVTRAPFFGDA